MISRLQTILLTIIIFALPSHIAFADANHFNEANAAYSSGNFGQAITIYEDLIEKNGYAPGVLYNLANSYAMTGQTGLAVLNYERALRLAPGDSDITGNLQLLRTESGLFAKESTFSERLLHLLSMDQWTGLGGFALLVLSGTLVLSIWFTFPRKITTSVCICSIMVILVATITTLQLHTHWNSSVVIIDSKLQVSPFEGAAGAGEIQQGRLVLTKKSHGDYLFVEDETNRQGWLPAASVRSIIAR